MASVQISQSCPEGGAFRHSRVRLST